MTRAGTFLRRNFEPLILSVQVVIDLVVVVLACLAAWWLRESLEGSVATPLTDYREVFAITAAVCLVCFHAFGLYSPSKSLLNVEEYKAVSTAGMISRASEKS